jgi:inorganic pyrophosphatase/manganese-dependent inorganic pyrophosphatase
VFFLTSTDQKQETVVFSDRYGSDHMNQTPYRSPLIVTAGSTYLDIDAYACAVALAELLRLKGENAIAYSRATVNYSVTPSLTAEKGIHRALPPDFRESDASYIIVDVSDPDYIKDGVPLDRVAAVYDHHAGFEDFWRGRIGENTHIEFIGAAATLILREWNACGLLDRMSPATARLLVAAILDNTLNLTSSNTTDEDKAAFAALCGQGQIDPDWRAMYFTEVQEEVERDLKNALMGDLKTMKDTSVLPPRIAQLCVWDTHRILERLPEIRTWFAGGEGWLMNIIGLRENRSCFVCGDPYYQRQLERVFGVRFEGDTALTAAPYLRKQIIKKAYF